MYLLENWFGPLLQVLTDNHLQWMASLASIQGVDNKKNQFNFEDSGHGEKELDRELFFHLSVPRQMVEQASSL